MVFIVKAVSTSSSFLRKSVWKAILKPSVLSGAKGACRFVSERSFAERTLKAQGESLEPHPKEPYTIITEETINQPTEKVLALINSVLELNVVEIQMFSRGLQKRLGISEAMMYGNIGGGANAAAAAAPSMETSASTPATPAAAKKEKEAFDLKLTVVDAKAKIKIIKEIRTITGLGLKEAKELVEKAPVMVKEGLNKEDVEKFKALLVEAGAQVEVL